jgi:drug/metabolite transporter (DMT)-like permease
MLGKAYVAAAFVLAGSSVVAARFISDFLPPFTITFLSLAFAVATVIPLHGRQTVAALGRIGRRRWLLLFLQAFLGIALFRVFLTFGLRHIGAAEAGIVTGAAPALTALFAVALLRDPLTAGKAAGIVLTMAGMMVVQGFPFAAGFGRGGFAGYALVLAATACEALFAVLSRRMHLEDGEGEQLHPVSHAGIVSALALFLCFFPMLTESPLEKIPGVPAAGWAALAWYGAVVTVLAFTFMFSGAKLCDGYAISALTGVIPLSSLVLSIIFLDAEVRPHQWLGCALIGIAIGIIIKNTAPTRRQTAGTRRKFSR